MCRYREYHFTCSHVVTEKPPYLPCHPEDFCPPEKSDPPIKINKSGPCGATDCKTSAASPPGSGQHSGGTSWEATRSNTNYHGIGEEGGAGAKLRHTVSTKIKTITRFGSKKGPKKGAEEGGYNGFESYGADDRRSTA